MDLTIDRLTKQFGSKIAVDRVSTRLTPGVYGLLGANGAGKTTLMRIVCDVLRPTSGEIRFDGRDVRLLGDEYRARLGYLPQDFGYYPDFSALDFMCYLAALKGLDRRAARRRSLELLETVGLADVARQKVRTFSGGMKQRLGIAQAVLNDPAVLVLDEPTAGLDPKERVRFRNLIASFAQDKIVILSTRRDGDGQGVGVPCGRAPRRRAGGCELREQRPLRCRRARGGARRGRRGSGGRRAGARSHAGRCVPVRVPRRGGSAVLTDSGTCRRCEASMHLISPLFALPQRSCAERARSGA